MGVLALLIIGTWSSVGHADCWDTQWDYKWEMGDEERNIEQIMKYGKCVREEQKHRVGKWSCYVSKTVGILPSGEASQYFAQKFVITISEIDDSVKRGMCLFSGYGIAHNLDGLRNYCLANFEIKFSPSNGILVDT